MLCQGHINAILTPCGVAPCAGYVTKCLLSPDMQKLATVSSDKTVKLWNIDGFTLDKTLVGLPRGASPNAFQP